MTDYNIPTDRQIAEKARALICADLAHIYSMPELASQCGTNPFALKRIFQNQFGISISVYSRQVRIEKAKELLTTTNNTLQMIAETLGYSEGSNFQVGFKREVGCTPGDYRRRFSC